MTDIPQLADYVTQKLNVQLNTVVLPDEYYYQSLTLAAIDAVYSAQAQYPSVKSVVNRYCKKYDLTTFRNPREYLPSLESQESISDLLKHIEQVGILYFVENVVENRSRTSGRLKVEILLELLKVLKNLNIQTFQDIQQWLTQQDKQHQFIAKITKIHGIGDATSRYFLMLSGDHQMVKPDTMILRFIKSALGRTVQATEAVGLIQEVSRVLLLNYPYMNPRLLDYLIWSWQRNQSDLEGIYKTHSQKLKVRQTAHVQNSNIQSIKQKLKMTIPEKTQLAMHKRYKPDQLLSSTQIKDDVLADYPSTSRGSVMPLDYCCNKWNRDPSSGIYHIFYYVEVDKKYRLLPKFDITEPRKRGVCE